MRANNLCLISTILCGNETNNSIINSESLEVEKQ